MREKTPQTFSMGLRSGLVVSHGITLISFLKNQLREKCAVWIDAISFSNVHKPVNRSLSSDRKYFSSVCVYICAIILNCRNAICKKLDSQKAAHIMTPPRHFSFVKRFISSSWGHVSIKKSRRVRPGSIYFRHRTQFDPIATVTMHVVRDPN